MVSEETVQGGVRGISAGSGHNVEGSPARAAKFSCVVAPVDFEFLYCVLAYVEANSAGIIVRFRSIHSDGVASAVASIK